jgi:hypothetical protein
MHWTPTLDRRSRRIFFEQLREQGVRWYATSGQAGELIGVSIDAASRDLPGNTLSAAVSFANQHPAGTHLLSIRRTDGWQWVVGAHQGHVISQTDRWLCDDRQADALVQDLQQRFKDVCVVKLVLSSGSDLDLSASLPWMSFDTQKTSRLRRLPSSGKVHKGLFLGLLLVLLVVMWIGFQTFFKALLPANHDLELTPAETTDDSGSKIPLFEIHTPESLKLLLSRLDKVPVDPPGWQLQSIDCKVSEKRSHCESRYRRLSRQSDNSQLAQFAPPGWSIGVLGLDETLLETSFFIETQALQNPPNVRGTHWMIDLQRHSERTPFIDLGQTQTIDRTGQRIRVRSIAMRLPMRHKEMLADWQLPVRWLSVRLEVLPQAILDPYSGSLMLSLKGELLVTD